MEQTQVKKGGSQQNNASEGRNLDFSFRYKIEPHKFTRQLKEEPKKQEISSSHNETRDIQITLSPTIVDKTNFHAIKRLDEKMQKAENMLQNIIESENEANNNDNFHLFSNIRCSSESSQSESEKQTETKPVQVVKAQEIVYEKKEIQQSKKQKVERDKTTYRVSVLIKDDLTSQFVELDFTQPNVYENEVLVMRNFNQYKKEPMNIFRLSNLRVGEQKIQLKSIRRVAAFSFTLKKNQFQIEVIHSNGRTLFGAELKRHLYFLPEHYIWFSKIINAKLMVLGYQLGNSVQLLNNNVNTGWSGTYAEGFIFKKSKYLKNWSKRYVVINTQGLFSYKQKNQNYTVFVQMEKIRVISTEFDFYEKNLVLRLQTQQLKIDFAIPIQDYCVKIDNNWLFAFYRLLMEHKHPIKIA